VAIQVTLFSHAICFHQPCPELIVDFLKIAESKRMHMVKGRDGFDSPKSWTLQAARKDHVAIEPSLTWRHLSE
jgi:hypothetical protein